MAEAFGIVSGIVGLAPLLIQIISGIDKLRDIRQSIKAANDDMDLLLSELNCLVCLMQAVDDAAYRDDAIFALCQQSCGRVREHLESLNGKVLNRRKTSGASLSNIRIFRHWKDELASLQQEINASKINLSLLLHSCQLRYLRLGNKTSPACSPTDMLELTEESSQLAPQVLPPGDPSPTLANEIAKTHRVIKRQKLKYRQDCLSRSCCCQCHHSERAFGRFWALDYSLMGIFQTCNVEECNAARYGVNLRLALTQLGIHRSVVIKVHFLSGLGSFSPSFSLQTECTVPYTSPGFEVMWRCENGMIEYQDARNRLIHLHQSDPNFRYHVNPAGRSYVEELLRRPWGGFATRDQFGLLQLLMGDLGMIQGSMNPRFLTRCAKWIGEGPHLALLDKLMHLDFDAGEVEVQKWPEPCSPDWSSESVTPDPFFVEYIGILCKDNQGFAGMTPLHEAVLFGSPQSVEKWTERSKPDEKNFLGQTPLHLAVYKPEYLTVLIESGHDVDVPDNYGITPLMYAAATNQEEAFYILISAHADLTAVDSRFHRTFFGYAVARRNWCLIYNLLLAIKQSAEKEVAESWVRAATINARLAVPDFDYDNQISLRHFLALCQDVNFTYDNGEDRRNNCLLHDIKTVSDLEALIDNGFKMINHVNSLGQHALINAAKRHDVAMTSRLLELGAEVNLEDNQQRTAIGHALRGLNTSDVNRICSTMDVVRVLLAADANVLVRDRCRCPCSPTGCLTATTHKGCSDRFGWGLHFPIWTLEWLNLVHEHRGVEAAREVVLSLIRETTHEDLEMTHVCCEFQLDECPIGIILGSKKSEDDVDEIIEEEQEFADILNTEMDHRNEEEYEVLLNYWFTLIRNLIRKAARKAAETKRQEPLRISRMQGPEIDYKNDCFVYNTSVDMDQYRNPVPGVQSSVGKYVLWMEHEYHHGKTSELETPIREGWYSKRASLLCRLLSIIDIPVESVTDRVTKLQPLYIDDGRKDPIDPKPYMEHFRASASNRWSMEGEKYRQAG